MEYIDWRWQRLDDFKANELYQMLALRQRVFVIEQRCIYLDADGVDTLTEHLTGYDGDQLIGPPRAQHYRADLQPQDTL